MVHFALANPARRMRRLRYRSGRESLSFSYTYPERRTIPTVPDDEPVKPDQMKADADEDAKGSWLDELERMLDETEKIDRERAEKQAGIGGVELSQGTVGEDAGAAVEHSDMADEMKGESENSGGLLHEDSTTGQSIREDLSTQDAVVTGERPDTAATPVVRLEDDSPEDDLVAQGMSAAGSTAEEVAAAAGHPDAARQLEAELSESASTSSPTPPTLSAGLSDEETSGIAAG